MSTNDDTNDSTARIPGLDLAALTEDQQDELAMMVHKTASQLASEAINGREEVAFLLGHGWTASEIRR